ncbi:hypothetical protein ACS0TY_029000 [Phlomoides rotata]
MIMNEKNHDLDKSINDDFMLPGFRFHPTDEELVEFYLKRKLQHRSLPIELIKQVDIYKYDPWDLPKLASTGEKEWYFYCPRDRKYRNSTRPNRVTGSGFWKATGTDRPIYSSDGAKCIGLKKSLVFYRGRAAKGMKTDWMMHEFRLPSATDGGAPPPPKKTFDKSFPARDSWAICRIFKKTNSMANRALSHSFAASLSETTSSDHAFSYTQFTPENQFHHPILSPLNYFPENIAFSPPEEVSGTSNKSTVDLTSIFFEACKNSELEPPQHQFNGGYPLPVIQANNNGDDDRKDQSIHNMWDNIRSIGFPFSLPAAEWKPNSPWDSPPCPSEVSSTTYSTNKCYI